MKKLLGISVPVLTVWCALFAGAACSSGSSGSGASTLGDGLTLAVNSAVEGSSIDGPMQIAIPAPPGQVFITIDMALTNDSASPAPLAVAFFSLQTQEGVQYTGAPQTAMLSAGCNQTASVSTGGTTDCSVVFSVPQGATPSELVYQTVDGRTASASVSVTPCVTCGSDCIDVTADDKNCGGCGVDVGLGHCVGGKPSCNAGATVCGGTCVDLTTDPHNCGTCGHAAPPGTSCESGQVACPPSAQGLQILCGGVCVPALDPSHCGSCTRDCGGGGSCQCNGSSPSSCTDYFCDYQPTSIDTCSSVCSSHSQKCVSGGLAEYLCTPSMGYQLNGTCGATPPATFMGCPFTQVECKCQ